MKSASTNNSKRLSKGPSVRIREFARSRS
jgi:hypothetical protein